MLMEIAEIRHNGAVLRSLDSPNAKTSYWLPAEEWGYLSAPEWNEHEKDNTWEKARNRLEVGGELDVVLVPGRMYDLQVVSAQRLTPCDVDDSWRSSRRDMRIMDVSRDSIKGRIGNVSVDVGRQEYTDFLDKLGNNESLKDHGALAPGDFLSVVPLGCATPDMLSANWVVSHLRVDESWLRGSFLDAMAFLETDVKHCFKDVRGGPAPTKPEMTSPDDMIAEERQRKLTPEELTVLSPLLYVENNEACRVSWAAAMKSAGIAVTPASSLADAKEIVAARASEFKMAIIDGLLGKEGGKEPDQYDGIELAERLRSTVPDCRVVLTSGQNVTPALVLQWGHVAVHGFVPKPCLASDLLPNLEAAVAIKAPKPLSEWWAHEAGQADVSPVPSAPHKSREITIKEALAEFSRARTGMVIHVFRVHPRSWRGKSMEHLGEGLNWVPFREKFGKSVIKDAACQDGQVVDNQCSEEGGRHLWTRQMMKYGSFWGKRLEAPGPYRYVFAIFHLEREVFDEVLSLKALACTERVTRVIARDQLLSRGEHDTEYIAAGLGFGCLAHEIYDDLTGVDGAAQQIAESLSGVETPVPEALDKARTMADLLVRNVPDLIRTARILRGRAGRSGPISVEYCLDKAAQVARRAIREAAKNQKDIVKDVPILLEAPAPNPDNTCLVNALPSALVTVFFNVFLNAAQQIGLMRCVRRQGRVWASVERFEDERANPWAVVRVHDTGPGIHPDDWESIFEPGHTTKHEGTGLGLHICRQLLGNIKEAGRSATIEVTHSVVWGGTTFAIRLPLAQ